MSKMGRYCKAYPVERFRAFDGWTENLANIRKDKKIVEGKEVEFQRTLGDNDHFYLQEDFTVTDDIFLDENVIFNNVTPEWVEFCKNTLKFEVPVYEEAKAN